VYTMERVGIREVRMRLRELLQRVASGEEVIILRRGKEVARLVPPRKKGRLEDLKTFRESISLRGEPASVTVSRLRGEEWP